MFSTSFSILDRQIGDLAYPTMIASSTPDCNILARIEHANPMLKPSERSLKR
jgi:hypothetical protein